MISDNEYYSHYSLLEKLEDEDGEWWTSYTEAITEDDSWEMGDEAVLAIAYLVESGHLTYEEVDEATKALKRCSDWDIGKATFIERVMKDAARERGKIKFKPVTYQDFFEMFNAISRDNHACPAYRTGVLVGVAIVDPDGVLIAVLYDDDCTWRFDTSAFNSEELFLMARLAATLPKDRGEIDNERD